MYVFKDGIDSPHDLRILYRKKEGLFSDFMEKGQDHSFTFYQC